MQTLDIISVNLWHVLVSLANLVIIFWVVKRFLFGPIKKMLAARQAELDHQYAAAKEAQDVADANRDAWEQKMQGADAEAERILKQATDTAKYRADQIVSDASERAESIKQQAEREAELERKKATEGIKREIVDVSTTIAEKMLEREVNENDHRALIGSFIDKIGESDEGDQ
jgi:F-type H+-transporting ATPase subunit b